MCVRVQVTLPYNSTLLINVLYIILLFQWICLDLNTVCREGTTQKIHRKSSSWFSHYTIWAIAAINTMSGWFKITARVWKGWGRPLQSVWGLNNFSKQNCFSLQFGGCKLNSKPVGISLTVGEKGGGLNWMAMRQDSAMKRVNKILISIIWCFSDRAA
jgi:hypothetical protein